MSPYGLPWSRELRGTLDKLEIDSNVLAENPLEDPATRPLYVYTPPDAGSDPLPTIYLIQGMTGQLDMWFNRNAFEPTVIERVDELFTDRSVPRAIVVYVDAWTSYGGSQFINSSATGAYMDYLCDEVVVYVDEQYPTIRDAAHRGLTGKSSGGYGAMVVPMLRPDVFGALASHSGDALFEACYQKDFADTARILRDKFDGSYEVFWERFRKMDRLEDPFFVPLNTYTMAACYSPDDSNPGGVDLPFDIATSKLIDDVWDRWLAWDPVRMVPKHADALASMKLIYLDAGKSDEWYLDLGAQAVSTELTKLGIDHTFELFDGHHGGISYRYPLALRALAEALTT